VLRSGGLLGRRLVPGRRVPSGGLRLKRSVYFTTTGGVGGS
jgi:hypothetical protein